MITVKLVGDRELVARLTSMPDRVKRELAKKVTVLSLRLESKIKQKLSGDVLNVVSGNLRRSIFAKVPPSVTSTSVIGGASSSGDVKYAGIHEFGGTINHPGGTPYIVTEAGAQFISKAAAAGMKTPPPVTKPHPIPMPEKSFMRTSLAEMRSEIVEGLSEAVKVGMSRESRE